MKISLAGQPSYVEKLGQVEPKESAKEIRIPDIAQPVEIGLELYINGDPRPVDGRKLLWRPQKKWKLYCVAYSHHDLGFGDYPHRLRTTIRHANISRPLQFCRDTDGWDEDEQVPFLIETSEPITSFLGQPAARSGRGTGPAAPRGPHPAWRFAQHGEHGTARARG